MTQKNTRPKLDFFLPEAKMGCPMTQPVFFAGQPNPTREMNHFLKLFSFWIKKI